MRAFWQLVGVVGLEKRRESLDRAQRRTQVVRYRVGEGLEFAVGDLQLARAIGNAQLKFAADLMGYFEKTPELGDAAEANEILGAPGTTLDAWIDEQKAAVP